MHAYQIKQNLDNLDQLAGCLTQVPDPKPAENQVLIDIKCAGMNFFDTLQVRGLYQDQPPFPFIPGAEFSGVISKESPIPKGCHFVPGKTRVFGTTQGSYATKACVAWDKLIEIPPGLDFERSAGIFVTYPTSYASLINRGKLKKGEWCLVHAAAGGVGIAAVQIAKAVGARVIATASSQEKLEFVRKYGGLSDKDFTLVYDDTPAPSANGPKKKASMLQWQAQVLKITQGKGVDVVFDPVGILNKSLKVAAYDCRLVVVGFAGGQIEKVPANLLLLKNATVTGVFWGATVKKEPEEWVKVWAALLELINRGQIRPVLHTKIYNGLEALPDGLKDLGSRKVLAKAILRIDSHPQSKL
ncbi:hypothetical protein PCANC_00657 [Puccinia coronata f. sp. avenae]|uniref:Enoyl reductase (ER) domain-containing protein n=1 Tax=Puccinia coronata f. sp. avenae TaxID=200324 RepID=A0A2N5W6W0_9BASI|nr:hypothetical protein PCANC_00657 [Puccinia coronata f. sp. avenae]